jgi:hypothetical protein
MPIRFTSKLFACLVFALLISGTILLIGVPPRVIAVSDQVIFGGAVLGLVTPLLWLPVWVWLERRNKPDSTVILSRLREGIAFLTGFGISIFGWKKMLHLQFRVALSFADRPASQLDGETLTWFYFGHSYAFACIVGCLQVGGAMLLFFRRTRLAGAVVLFPIMVNILLINIFYQMNAGALLQSVLLTIGLLYILGLYMPLLLSALFSFREQGRGDGRVARVWIGAVVAGGLSFVFVTALSRRLPPKSAVYGRYAVENLCVNGVFIRPGNFDSALTRVYFDLDDVCVLEYNNGQRRLVANYSFIDKTTVESEFPDKNRLLPFRASVGIKNDTLLSLKGHLAADSIEMKLRRVPR